MLLQQSIEHVFIVYTCNTYFVKVCLFRSFRSIFVYNTTFESSPRPRCRCVDRPSDKNIVHHLYQSLTSWQYLDNPCRDKMKLVLLSVVCVVFFIHTVSKFNAVCFILYFLLNKKWIFLTNWQTLYEKTKHVSLRHLDLITYSSFRLSFQCISCSTDDECMGACCFDTQCQVFQNVSEPCHLPDHEITIMHYPCGCGPGKTISSGTLLYM